MRNDEALMTKDEGMTKCELIRHSSFGIISSFVIRRSDFVILIVRYSVHET